MRLHIRRRSLGMSGGMARSCASPACIQCFDKCRQAFTVYGSFDDFTEKRHADAQTQQHWAQAHSVQESPSSASWFLSHVDAAQELEMDVEGSLVGVDRAQLVQLLDGVAPEHLGLKLENLKNERRLAYRGPLVVDPKRPYVTYTYRSRHKVSQTS